MLVTTQLLWQLGTTCTTLTAWKSWITLFGTTEVLKTTGLIRLLVNNGLLWNTENYLYYSECSEHLQYSVRNYWTFWLLRTTGLLRLLGNNGLLWLFITTQPLRQLGTTRLLWLLGTTWTTLCARNYLYYSARNTCITLFGTNELLDCSELLD